MVSFRKWRAFAMGLLSILKKVKEKEKEIRVLMLWVGTTFGC